jgi:hypothetical protein
MNPLEHRILEVLQASSDGHSTAFNVFNVLNRDGYNVTKHEFEEACKELHHCTCITYRPIRYPNRNPRSTDQVSGPVSVFRGCRPSARGRGPRRGFGGGVFNDRRNSLPDGIRDAAGLDPIQLGRTVLLFDESNLRTGIRHKSLDVSGTRCRR